MGCRSSKHVNTEPTPIPAPADSYDESEGRFAHNPLTSDEINERIIDGKEDSILICHDGNKLSLKTSWVSQRGFYPEALDKANQDAFLVNSKFDKNNTSAFFGVFDGN